MALEYNGQRIGAMQYNGHTIGEAMIDGQVVYKSAPPVNPYTLGAVSWLPLNGDFSDHGVSPITWNPRSGTVIWGDGYIKQLGAAPAYNGGFAFNPTTGASISGWIYVPSTALTGVRMSAIEVVASFSEMDIMVIATSASKCVIEVVHRRGNTASVRREIPGTYSTNTWYHVVATMFPQSPGSTTWTVRGYVNGSMSLNASQAMGTQHAVTFNGASIDSNNVVWVDDVSIYNRSLTPEEVSALYVAGPN